LSELLTNEQLHILILWKSDMPPPMMATGCRHTMQYSCWVILCLSNCIACNTLANSNVCK